MTTLRWLHFTDLHIDRPDDARRQLAGDLFLEDLKRVTRKLGPWDVVLFTGDLAYSGREEQYKPKCPFRAPSGKSRRRR
jgi:3',5'-cyclic AMP phosphodiesterase CpdA